MDPTLELEEAAVGMGGVCGSVLLNTRFLDLVEKKVGTLSAEDRKDVCRMTRKMPSLILITHCRSIKSSMRM